MTDETVDKVILETMLAEISRRHARDAASFAFDGINRKQGADAHRDREVLLRAVVQLKEANALLTEHYAEQLERRGLSSAVTAETFAECHAALRATEDERDRERSRGDETRRNLSRLREEQAAFIGHVLTATQTVTGDPFDFEPDASPGDRAARAVDKVVNKLHETEARLERSELRVRLTEAQLSRAVEVYERHSTRLAALVERLEKTDRPTEAPGPIRWLGQCLKCGTCYEKHAEKRPCSDADGKSYGTTCPECRKHGFMIVGVVHFNSESAFVEDRSIKPPWGDK